jgi:hypothetical protein
MIPCRMSDLCRIMFGIIVDLFRYVSIFVRRFRSRGIRDHPTSARAPRQNGYAECLIRSICRECLDQIVVTGEQHLRRILKCYMATRAHLSLGKDAPIWRVIHRVGRIEVRPVLGGLHHRYVRICDRDRLQPTIKSVTRRILAAQHI